MILLIHGLIPRAHSDFLTTVSHLSQDSMLGFPMAKGPFHCHEVESCRQIYALPLQSTNPCPLNIVL
jgi:hypothetical protein